VVTRLDWLAHSSEDRLDIPEKLQLDAGLRSPAAPRADTTLHTGRMVLAMSAGIAEFERELSYQRAGSGRGE